MTIYDLRNIMKVDYYYNTSNGACIIYYRDNNLNTLTLTNDELLKELIAIGSLDDGEHIDKYTLSQWDALNIVIRFELARETEKQIDNADIGKAIENLKNNQ